MNSEKKFLYLTNALSPNSLFTIWDFPFFDKEGSIVMGSLIQTLEVIGLANSQYNNLRDLLIADKINS